MKRVT